MNDDANTLPLTRHLHKIEKYRPGSDPGITEKGTMPDNTDTEKVKRTTKRLAGEGRRKRRFGLSPDEARRWRRFFSVVCILLLAVMVLTVLAAFNHYNL